MKQTLLLLVSFFIINSCGESTEDLLGINNVLQPSTNKVLSKIKYAETGEIPYDVIYNWSNGKLITITTSNNSTSYSIEYAGNQILKVTQITGQGTQLNTTTSNLNYTNGMLSSINGTDVSSTSTTNFSTTITYNGTKPTFIKRNFTSGSTIVYTESFTIEYNGANISKASTLFGVPSLQLNAILTYNSYDNMKNPFQTLPEAFSISNSFINQDAGFSLLGLNMNNFTKVSTSGPGVTPTTEITVFTYGTDGYPTKSISSDFTLQYEYINL